MVSGSSPSLMAKSALIFSGYFAESMPAPSAPPLPRRRGGENQLPV